MSVRWATRIRLALVVFAAMPFVVAMALAWRDITPSRAATTITVTTTNDELNTDGDCSLREAIQAANTDTAVDACPAGSGADTINVPSGIYTLTIPPTYPYDNASGDLDIYADATVDATGAIIQACDSSGGPCTGIDRVLSIIQYEDTHVTATISGVTIRNGKSSAGGGIYNSGSLTLSNSTVSGNSADYGGGIANNGRLVITDSTISGNSGGSASGGVGGILTDSLSGGLVLMNSTVGYNTGFIGGIYVGEGGAGLINSTVNGNTGTTIGGVANSAATLTLTNTTVSGNTGGYEGGIDNGSKANLTNSTVSGNTGGYVGGLSNAGGMTLTNSTVSGNTGGAGYGGGISNTQLATVLLKNTIVAGSLGGDNCLGAIASLGHNLSSDSSCPFSATGDLNGTDPLLGPLADNGGPTLTHALLPGSPAIDAGSSDCPPPNTDQRGFARPVGASCDIGAYEFGAPPPTPTPTPAPAVGGVGLDPTLPGIAAHGAGAHGHAPLQWALAIGLVVVMAAAALRLAGRQRT